MLSLRILLRLSQARQLPAIQLHPGASKALASCRRLWGGLASPMHYLNSYKTCRSSYGGRINTSLPALCLSVAVVAGSQKDDEDSEIIKSMKLAVLCIQKEEYEKAEQILHLTLRMAQEQANTAAVTYIYDLLANIAFKQDKFSKAEKLLLELTRRLAATVSTEDNAFVEVSLKLASVYASQGDAERAEEGFRFCLDTQQRKIDAVGELSSDPDTLGLWGMTADWYARFLTQRGEFRRARQLTERALALCVRLSGEAAEQSVVLLNDLATLDSLCGEYELAAERLGRAVQLAEQNALPDLPYFYVNLGMARLQQGLLKEAKRACAAGRRLAGRQKDQNTLDMADKCLAKVKALM